LLDAALRALCWLVSNLASLFKATNSEGTLSGPPGPLTLRSRHRRRLEGPAVDAQRRTRTLPNHASKPILRDDRFAISQDEHGGCCRRPKATEALILSRPQSGRPSKDERGLTSLTARTCATSKA
jgi:hypothetical protein